MPRILDRLRPHPLVVGGMQRYWMARWKGGNWPGLSFKNYHKKKKPWQRGWMPGRLRLDGMRAPTRVINPAVRYQPVIRQYNELLPHLWKQQAFKRRMPWGRFNPKRSPPRT